MDVKKADNRRQKFIEFCALGESPYSAALKAGYTLTYAKTFSHKLLEKYKNEINALKPAAKEAIEAKFKYSVEQSFEKLNEIQGLALLQDDKGNFNNLSAAIKAEELKGKLYGCYEADNKQKTVAVPIIIDDI